jgi:hypothetical protein
MDVYYALAIGISSILVFSAGIIFSRLYLNKPIQHTTIATTSSVPGPTQETFPKPFPTGVTHLTDEKDNQLAAQIKEEQLK